MAQVNPLLAAILIIGILLLTIVLVIVIVNRQGSVTPNSIPTAVPCIQAPPAPTGLAVTNPQGDLLILTWNRLEGAETYTAYIGDEPSFNIDNALGMKNTRFNSASFANIELGRNYYFKVFATNSCGSSAFSAEFVFNLPYDFPQRFVIASRLNTSFVLCDNHADPYNAFDDVVASIYCTPLESWAYYEGSDNTIRQSSRPTYCMTRSGTQTSGGIINTPCNGSPNQKWSYDTATNQLCSLDNPNLGCINMVSLGSFTRAVGHSAPVSDILSDWAFLAV